MATETRTLASGTFCWADLSTTDPAAAGKFYQALFGWQAQDMPMGDGAAYTMWTSGGKMAAGMAEMAPQQRQQGVPPFWLSHVQVASAADAAQKAASLGGTVLLPAMEVMGMGHMALIQDPTGAVLSLWQPHKPENDALYNEPVSLCWNELLTSDTDRAATFYTGLFGWGKGSPEFMTDDSYTTFSVEGREQAGMMALPENARQAGAPSMWLPYFAVANTDGIMARAKELGGKVHMGPMDIPTVGRLAVLADPQGATFAVAQLLNPGA